MKTLLIAALVVAASVAQAQTPAERSAFRQFLVSQQGECYQNAGTFPGVPRDRHVRYCDCAAGVFADNMTREQMSIARRLQTGQTTDDRLTSSERSTLMGMTRIQPLLASCGDPRLSQ